MDYDESDKRDHQRNMLLIKWGIGIVVFLILVFLSSFWWGPEYNVWQQGLAGQAELSRADYNRKVQVVNAQANVQAQVYNAQAEVARARGVAQANNVIKNSITDQYVRYLWVQTLDHTNNQIIYVPEGADGLPITEAARGTTGK